MDPVVLGSRLFVALDAGSVSGGVVSFRLGRLKVHSYVRVPLPQGALTPSVLEPNVLNPLEVKTALLEVAGAVGADGRRACLILPDGLSRTVLLDVPPGVEPREFGRFRLTPSLPYPEREAVVDGFAVGRGRFLASAVRRSVIEGYEAVFAQAGFLQERLDLAPIAALSGILRRAAQVPGVDLILGDAAFSLAVLEAGVLRLFRHRLRDQTSGEAERLWDEVVRTASHAEIREPRIRVVGAGATDLVEGLRKARHPVEAGWDVSLEGVVVEAAEIPWLGAAMA
jgi:hypothetical protein